MVAADLCFNAERSGLFYSFLGCPSQAHRLMRPRAMAYFSPTKIFYLGFAFIKTIFFKNYNYNTNFEIWRLPTQYFQILHLQHKFFVKGYILGSQIFVHIYTPNTLGRKLIKINLFKRVYNYFN